MKIKVGFEMNARVEFKDPEKAKEYFIDGRWKDVFYKLDDLNELAKNLAYDIYQSEAVWRDGIAKFVEGFGHFLKGESRGEWIIKDPDHGEIVVFIGDIDVSSCETVLCRDWV